MPEQLNSLLGYLIAFGLAILTFMAKDWWKVRVNGKFVTTASCEQCRAQCRAELSRDLEAGDKTFNDIRHDISSMKTATMGIVLALIPICEKVTDGQADCSELRRIARTLAE